MVRLSIIIPFYNVEQYIAQCLDSAYDQDIPEKEYEVICVDDCGSDNSIRIVEEYAKKHDNLVIVRNKINRKLGGARNAGMEVAKGRYIWYVDSDDFIETNCFKELLTIAENQDLDMLHFNYVEYPNVNKPEIRPVETDVMTGPDMFFSNNFIWYHDLVTAWRKLYNREFLMANHIHFAEHIMFEDNDYAIVTFANAQRVKHIAKEAYHYRENPESIKRVDYSSVHIGYWLNLCHRLVAIKDQFIETNKDVRYIREVDAFIRNLIYRVLKTSDGLNGVQKKKSKEIIMKEVNKELKPYMSRLQYCKIRLHIL